MRFFIIFSCVIATFFSIWKVIILKRYISKHDGINDSNNNHDTEIKVDYRSLLNKHLKSQCKSDNVSDIDISSETEIMNHFIDSCTELIIQHISDHKYSVIKLSQDMFMDRSGFYKKIKKAAKCTPKMFIKNIRINYVIGLLEQKKYSYEEIARMSGLESVIQLSLEYPSIFDYNYDDKRIILKEKEKKII